jgi:hypothetical protein
MSKAPADRWSSGLRDRRGIEEEHRGFRRSHRSSAVRRPLKTGAPTKKARRPHVVHRFGGDACADGSGTAAFASEAEASAAYTRRPPTQVCSTRVFQIYDAATVK